MPPAPIPSEKLKEFSLRLSEAVEADAAHWRLPAWLVAMIVAFIKEIAESLAELAKLLREGKIPLPPATQRQGSRPASTRKRGPAAARVRSPRPRRDTAEPPAAAPARQTPPTPTPLRIPATAPRPMPRASACGPPNRTRYVHPPTHVYFVTISN